MVNRRRVLMATVPFLLIAWTGCKNSQSINGTWKGTGAVPVELVIKDDGTYEANFKAQMKIQVIGTWTFKRPRLTLKSKDVILPDIPFAIPDEQKTALMKRYGNQEFSISWKTDDEIVISGDPPFSGGFRRQP